jgi:hypothetical protein
MVVVVVAVVAGAVVVTIVAGAVLVADSVVELGEESPPSQAAVSMTAVTSRARIRRIDPERRPLPRTSLSTLGP